MAATIKISDCLRRYAEAKPTSVCYKCPDAKNAQSGRATDTDVEKLKREVFTVNKEKEKEQELDMLKKCEGCGQTWTVKMFKRTHLSPDGYAKLCNECAAAKRASREDRVEKNGRSAAALTLRLSPEMLDVLRAIAEKEMRPLEMQVLYLLWKSLRENYPVVLDDMGIK